MNIVCIKHGTKYSSEYVNRLYSMVKRYAPSDFKFYCMTESSEGIDDDINVVLFPKNNIYEKWWNKMWALDRFVKGDTILFDLDIIIHGSLDKLFELDTQNLTVLYASWKNQEFGSEVGNTLFNSSIMKWRNEQGKVVSDVFFTNPKQYLFDYKGIDRFMWNENVQVDTLPTDIAYSYINSDCKYNDEYSVCILNETQQKQHELSETWISKYWN